MELKPLLMRQGRGPTALESTAIRALAEKIAADLFTDGNDEVAQRLVLELPGGRNGGGWAAGPAVDRIEKILRGEA